MTYIGALCKALFKFDKCLTDSEYLDEYMGKGNLVFK